jgi:hypothetical protein
MEETGTEAYGHKMKRHSQFYIENKKETEIRPLLNRNSKHLLDSFRKTAYLETDPSARQDL